jgi:hypothetical protein
MLREEGDPSRVVFCSANCFPVNDLYVLRGSKSRLLNLARAMMPAFGRIPDTGRGVSRLLPARETDLSISGGCRPTSPAIRWPEARIEIVPMINNAPLMHCVTVAADFQQNLSR